MDLKTQVKSLMGIVSELRGELKKLKEKDQGEETLKRKEEEATRSFYGTTILTDDENKKLISKWVHPSKVIKFNPIFNTNVDGDSSSTFHLYCDGLFPTLTVILDTSGRLFGGYATQSFSQSTVGANYSRAPGSFIFNLSNKKKFELIDQIGSQSNQAIYKHNSLGPTFGGGHDLCLCGECRSNSNSYCNKASYNTDNINLLGGSSGSSTNFQVQNYEVYHVIFD